MHEIPPNGQGIAALIALGILDKFDVESLTGRRIESQHLQIEAMKLAFADVYRYVADPRSMEVTPEQMLDDAYLTERAKLIDPKRAHAVRLRHADGGRHDLPVGGRRARHDGELHPVELHGLRLGRRRAGHGHRAAEPRLRLLDGSEVSRTSWQAASGRSTRSSRRSSRRR